MNLERHILNGIKGSDTIDPLTTKLEHPENFSEGWRSQFVLSKEVRGLSPEVVEHKYLEKRRYENRLRSRVLIRIVAIVLLIFGLLRIMDGSKYDGKLNQEWVDNLHENADQRRTDWRNNGAFGW